MARLPRAVDENLHFLCAEIDGQLSGVQSYFHDPGAAEAQKVVQRAGYAVNLASRVQNASLQGLSRKKVANRTQLVLRNVDLVARNLDQIGRLARRSLIHAEDVRHKSHLRPEVYPKVIKAIRASLRQIQPALAQADSKAALRIGQTRDRLDDLYDRMFRTLTADMHLSSNTADLAHALLAATEIHRIGDPLQAISEAILSVTIGQSVHLDSYVTLQNLVPDSGGETPDLEPLAETRSGSAISALRSRDASGETVNAVFKDGELSKVREERAGVKSWHSIYPGLAPRILSYETRGQSAALLIEHLPGQTFEQLVLAENDTLLSEAQKVLSKTLRDVWRRTRMDEPAEMNAMGQLAHRLADVYRVHPEFRTAPARIGGLKLLGFDELVARAARRETELGAPFSVHIHGDFNLDNVIYDPGEKRVHFIDLHRSRYMDYVQDVSVFMVSSYRLQIQDIPVRRRLAQLACSAHDVAAKFARSQRDATFEVRMALGLARSFASSTRYVFDKSHARRMFLKARFLLELVQACPDGREARFKLPTRELFFD